MGRLTALVLGAAAGGGFPQWNCNCPVCALAWAGDRPRDPAQPGRDRGVGGWRELAPLQRLARPAGPDPQHPGAASRSGLRHSPIRAVLLTGAEIDQAAGLLTLRERQDVALYATPAILAAIADNPMFGALHPDRVTRHARFIG